MPLGSVQVAGFPTQRRAPATKMTWAKVYVYMYICMCIYIYIYVCVCVCVYTCIYIYIYIYIYIHVFTYIKLRHLVDSVQNPPRAKRGGHWGSEALCPVAMAHHFSVLHYTRLLVCYGILYYSILYETSVL